MTVDHGPKNDYNVTVDITYDKGGRVTQVSNPDGKITTYEYDQLGRRTKVTNPLNQDRVTAYEDLSGGGSRTTQTLPGVNSTGASSYNVQRDFDRLGRLTAINYGDPTVTPDVTVTYDSAGNRASMVEDDGSNDIRKTTYGYDAARRLTSVAFDADADNTPEHTVTYDYDVSGRRTAMTVDGLTVQYQYDETGQLVGMTDWDSQVSDFSYDGVGRHILTERANDLDSSYTYDAAGRLTGMLHQDNSGTPVKLAEFGFTLDGRGNRVQASERVRRSDNSLHERTLVYEYDQLSRLERACITDGFDNPGGTISQYYCYSYDVAGNRVKRTVDAAVTNYTYNAANQLTGDGTNTFTYDPNGNLLGDGTECLHLGSCQPHVDRAGQHILRVRWQRGSGAADGQQCRDRLPAGCSAGLDEGHWRVQWWQHRALSARTAWHSGAGGCLRQLGAPPPGWAGQCAQCRRVGRHQHRVGGP